MIVGVRHARVENPEGVVYARLPGFRLSDEGREEAERLAEALRRSPVAAVYASPLERAQRTAGILAAPHGLPVVPDGRLDEWAFWVRWQGLSWTRLRERDPDLLEAYAHDPASACPEEPLPAVARRVAAWAEEAEARHGSEGLVLGVTHEAPLVAALLVGSGRGLSAYHTTNLPHLGAVRVRPGPPEVVDLMAWALAC